MALPLQCSLLQNSSLSPPPPSSSSESPLLLLCDFVRGCRILRSYHVSFRRNISSTVFCSVSGDRNLGPSASSAKRTSAEKEWSQPEPASPSETGTAARARSSIETISLGIKDPVYEVIEVNSDGMMSKKTINRRHLLKSSGLRPRDIRSVDPSLWLMNSMPSLLVREQAILLNFGSLRAIAMQERVLVFDYNRKGGKAFLESLLPRLNPKSMNGVPCMPFELEVVEAALISRIQGLEQRLMDIEPKVEALLEVLPVRLTADVLEQLRLSKQNLEICLAILGNLACHEGPRNALSSVNGLVETVINQLFLDDSLCLSGTCWLLMLCLQGSESVIWAKELLPGNVLSRILWIAGNTLNCQLLEKCLELLSTIIESQRVAPILLSSLVELGLSSLLVNLLASEIATLATGKGLDRCSILDSILCAVESLSITSDYSQAVSSNVELFQLVCRIIKLPDKIEVADSCITTVVLVANILTDNPNLLPGISKDLSFLHGLLDILPFVSNDSQARSALWSILARVLSTAEANAMRKLDLQQYAMLLVEKSHIINEDLDDHRGEDFAEDHTDAGKSNAKKGTLRRIANILDSRCDNSQKDASTDANVERLLSYCRNYAR